MTLPLMTLPRVLVLTDRSQLPIGRSLREALVECVGSGATHVVLREFDLPRVERAALATELIRISGIVLIAGRTNLPGASGMHLSADQEPIDAVGARFHGSSCHDEREVRRARVGGAKYVTVSPVAHSESKPGYGPPLGPTLLRRLAAIAGDMPAFALGGVTVDNAASFREAGAYGVAVMGALMRSEDPGTLTKRLLAEIER